MSTLVKSLRCNRRVVFDKGKFDGWCVFIIDEFGRKYAPRDIQYFTELKKIALNYPKDKVYDDFLTIYYQTTHALNKSVLCLIDSIVETYSVPDRAEVEKWFTVVYAGMVAEENKENAILKKRIKRLGIYQVLKLGLSPWDAANFSKGKQWQQLDSHMQIYNL